ncbi:hypothetical protein [Polyangium sp. 6x1]|uniref:hypothetical protein n=1 Tax=Polyangium sp. 6x1 TaxID=3042689 RepID=UPI0024832585|nr:hypothetical protein [Polyangium sp. 6x1]MDI1444703.1 hypothetical protein [Polyangium sp. 6x1]
MAEKQRKAVRVDRSLVAVPRGRSKRRRIRRFVDRAGKGVLLIAGAGAVVALLANLEDLKNSKEVKERWWLLPLGVIAIGYLLRKRGNPYAGAVLAVGGALFASGYALQSKQAQAKTPQTQPTPPLPPSPRGPQRGTEGPTTMWQMPPGAASGWVQLPNGEYVRIPVMSMPTT